MNWALIAKKYPEAYSEYIEWWKRGSGPSNDRDLYDFFDKRGIYVFIKKHHDNGTSLMYEIYTNLHKSPDCYGLSYLTRKEGEAKAFSMAFEILEGL